jgi:hypothetical protein
MPLLPGRVRIDGRRSQRDLHRLKLPGKSLSPFQGSGFLLDDLPRAARTSSCLPWATICRASSPWVLAFAV